MISVLFVRASLSASQGRDNIHRPFRVAQSLLDDSVLAYLESSEHVAVDTLQVNLQPYFPHGAISTRGAAASDAKGASTFAINIPVLREASHWFTALVRSLAWVTGTRGTPRVMFLMTNFPPVAFALHAMSRHLGVPRVVTLTDLSSFSYSRDRVAAAPWWKRRWMSAYASRVKALERSYDGYVLLTSHMAEVVNPSGRPHVVVEGVLNTHGIDIAENGPESDSKVLAHAGTLDRLYGIGSLLDAFGCIKDPKVELWLFGTGDMDEEIKKRANVDPRIRFHGFQPRALVFESLQRATILVNLRDPGDEYTKYSFPSKILEYMASGTPVATTSLTGIPREYAEFLYELDAATPDSIGQTLQDILGLPVDVLKKKGNLAREFVVSSKTAESQCPRIEEILIRLAAPGDPR